MGDPHINFTLVAASPSADPMPRVKAGTVLLKFSRRQNQSIGCGENPASLGVRIDAIGLEERTAN
jgi:hypothetical protein